MNKFQALLKFEFMSNMSHIKDDKLFSRIKKILLTLIGLSCIVAIFLYAINVIMTVFINEGMQHEFITYFSFFMMILHLVVGVTMATKSLFLKSDLSLLKLPVKGVEIFSAKFVYLYLRHLFYDLLLTLPIFIIFGIKTAQSVAYYLLLVPNVLFLPIIPLLLSILLSVPVMWLIKTFKNKFLVLLIFYTLALVAGFTLYIFGLKFILNILESGDFSNVFDSSTIISIKKVSEYLYIPLLFKNSLLVYNFWKSAVINLAIVCVLAVAVYFFADKNYFRLLLQSKNQSIYKKKTYVVSKSPVRALMSKEFKNIFRSTNYAFQYLTIVFTTPLMVYFSSEIASNVGISLLGEGVLPGIVVLILIMFLSMGTSFSATSITREGGNFYLTKIIPVSFSKQILVKLAIYLIISLPAIFVSSFVLAFANMISYLSALLIAISLSFVIIGNICYSIYVDIKRPQFHYLENGEVTSSNKNISSSISLGFMISFLMGIGGIFLSYFISIPSMYLVLFGFGVTLACVEVFRLFFHLEKNYSRIEV